MELCEKAIKVENIIKCTVDDKTCGFQYYCPITDSNEQSQGSINCTRKER